jgi:hypothetical protein
VRQGRACSVAAVEQEVKQGGGWLRKTGGARTAGAVGASMCVSVRQGSAWRVAAGMGSRVVAEDSGPCKALVRMDGTGGVRTTRAVSTRVCVECLCAAGKCVQCAREARGQAGGGWLRTTHCKALERTKPDTVIGVQEATLAMRSLLWCDWPRMCAEVANLCGQSAERMNSLAAYCLWIWSYRCARHAAGKCGQR